MSSTASETEYLFSYGTLQAEAVQLATFGRKLEGEPDALIGFAPTVIPARATPAMHGGATHHRNARYTGNPSDVVEGMRFTVTCEEVERSDAYEAPVDYRRLRVRLRSGIEAWVYMSIHEQRP